MQCPKCHNAAPDFHTSEGVTLNFCNGCHGLWFDKGELALYCETESDMPHLDDLIAHAQKTTYTCPRPVCAQTALVEVPYMAGEELHVDWCPTCHGAWLDAGELPKAEQLATRFESHIARLQRAISELQQAGYHLIDIKRL